MGFAILRGFLVGFSVVVMIVFVFEAEALFGSGLRYVVEEVSMSIGFGLIGFYIGFATHPSAWPLTTPIEHGVTRLGFWLQAHVIRAIVGVLIGGIACLGVSIGGQLLQVILANWMPIHMLSWALREFMGGPCIAAFFGSLLAALIEPRESNTRLVARTAAIVSIVSALASIWIMSIVVFAVVQLEKSGTICQHENWALAGGIISGIGGAVFVRFRRVRLS
jgi:hypothetical protein